MKTFYHVLGSIARTLLAITFLFSGCVKAIDPLGTVYKVEDYLAAFGGFFTHLIPVAFPIAIVLILAEFLLGWMLLTNTWTKVTSWLTLAFMLIMTPITLYLALTNAVADCGCFGDAIYLTNWQTFYKNIVLLVLVIILLCTQRFIPRTFLRYIELGGVIFAASIAIGIMTYSLTHLPFVDFRPYKIGNNITELMEIPDDAPMDEYEIHFIYEKDGEQREFTLADYPKDDSTWTFIDQKSILIKKGYEPPIHDFIIFDEEMEDITYDILEDESDVTLAILYKVEKANSKQAARLAKMAEEAAFSGRPFYLLTGSGDEEIEAFRNTYAYDYPIYFCDGTALKTVVRANPGIVVLRQGVVVDKYNLRNR